MASPSLVDLRHVVAHERQARVLAALAELPDGQSVELVSEHNPEALYYPAHQMLAKGFSWEFLESGPDVWRVVIARSDASRSPCCGACGGA